MFLAHWGHLPCWPWQCFLMHHFCAYAHSLPCFAFPSFPCLLPTFSCMSESDGPAKSLQLYFLFIRSCSDSNNFLCFNLLYEGPALLVQKPHPNLERKTKALPPLKKTPHIPRNVQDCKRLLAALPSSLQ